MRIVRQILHSAFRLLITIPGGGIGWGGFVFVLLAMAMMVLPSHASFPSLLIFAGAASKPPTEEIGKLFSQKKGAEVRMTFGGSGFVLSQMKLARKGDIYFPGSSDFMERAKRDKLVFAETEKIVVYLIPAINVQRGNPHKIRSLRDLTRPGIRLAIADPENVCVGNFAVEVIEKNLSPEGRESLRKNLVNTVESCEKTANIVSLKGVDAVIGWRVFQYWDPQRIETILLKPQEVPRIGYIPAAVSVFSKDRELAGDFIGFLLSSDGQGIFKKYGYLTTLEEARRYTLPQTPVGGEYSLPAIWKRRGK